MKQRYIPITQVTIEHLLTLATDSPADLVKLLHCFRGSSCPNLPETIGAGLAMDGTWKRKHQAKRKEQVDGSQYAGEKIG